MGTMYYYHWQSFFADITIYYYHYNNQLLDIKTVTNSIYYIGSF